MDERIENNKKLIRQFIELTWNQGRFNLAKSLAAPEFTYHASMIDTPMTLQNMGVVVESIREAFDDFTICIDELIAEGNQVVSQSTLSGCLAKPFMGFEPSDRMIALNAVTFWKVRQGVVQSGHSLLDTADLMHQANAIQGNKQAISIV